MPVTPSYTDPMPLQKIKKYFKASASNRDLTEGSIRKHMVSLTVPMVLGIVAIMLFNLADTYFIGQLPQPEALEAVAFTFPVTMLVFNVAIGISIGVSVGLARMLGKQDKSAAVCFTLDGLLLALLIGFILAGVGALTIDPVFALLNAEQGLTMDLIRDYMLIWYIGVPVLIIPVLGNSLMRATGDSLSPGLLMIASAVFNMILDPILIFGWGPIPGYGVEGAAAATVISWSLSVFIVLAMLRRKSLLAWAPHSLKILWLNWKTSLVVALPASLTNMLVPLSSGALTAMLAEYGGDVVAGFGVATRIESLALLVVFAMTAGISPLVAQNAGANKPERIKQAINGSIKFAIIFQLGMYVLLAVFAPFAADVFVKKPSPELTAAVSWALWLLPIGYGGQSVVLLMNSAFNALHKPLQASALNLFRLFVLYVPLAFVGGWLAGVPGVFAGAAIGNLLAGVIAWLYLKKSNEIPTDANHVQFTHSEDQNESAETATANG